MKCGTKHHFGQNAFNAAPDRYDASITKGFCKSEGMKIIAKAQLANIEFNKAMYEGWLDCMWRDTRHHDFDGTVCISVYGLANYDIKGI